MELSTKEQVDLDQMVTDEGRRDAELDRREAELERLERKQALREADVDRKMADVDRRGAELIKQEEDVDRRFQEFADIHLEHVTEWIEEKEVQLQKLSDLRKEVKKIEEYIELLETLIAGPPEKM